ncbi:MAG: Iron(3+)-hydroxamate import ATP-binding protein FhuC [Firmicutes bacterium ADurb.Bin182]|nr:MAG: Iron(3+)-hydroxamate import ATP-binding protein FhuC [Firmicutes bacterium ADurb.Bin182]
MSKLEAKGLRAGYGKKKVLRGIDLSIQEGEFCALLGLNGSGKTTLLKALCGLIPVKEGSCLIDGQSYLDFNERIRSRLISYTPQRYSVISGTTLLDAVLMGCNPYLPLLSSPGRRERLTASAALKRVGLAGMDDTVFDELSEGQKQLVILARAIVQESSVMLFDEPVSSLDFVNCHYVLRLIRDIIRENKRAGLITLHDPNLALYYCDRILLIDKGMIAGEILPEHTPLPKIRERLSLLYGNIDVLEYDKNYYMVKR